VTAPKIHVPITATPPKYILRILILPPHGGESKIRMPQFQPFILI